LLQFNLTFAALWYSRHGKPPLFQVLPNLVLNCSAFVANGSAHFTFLSRADGSSLQPADAVRCAGFVSTALASADLLLVRVAAGCTPARGNVPVPRPALGTGNVPDFTTAFWCIGIFISRGRWRACELVGCLREKKTAFEKEKNLLPKEVRRGVKAPVSRKRATCRYQKWGRPLRVPSARKP
jgi:hypothetical protein